jgi:hypothetical protein
MRTLLTTLAVAAATLAFGQAHHYFQAEAPYDRGALKQLVQAVVDLDPQADVNAGDDMTLLHVRSSASESELRAAINGSGVALRPGTPDLGHANPAPTTTPTGRPLMVLTGDPAADQARYAAAVAAWNEAHPQDRIELLNHITD